MIKKTLFVLGLLSTLGIQSISAMKAGYPITFNNQSDALLIVNEGMAFGGPSLNIHVNNVTSVIIKARDGSIIKHFSEDKLPAIHTINITKDADSGTYLIEAKRKAMAFAEVTFNNYPNDTEIYINGKVAKITPTRKNVTIKGVTSALLQKIDSTPIRLFTAEELQILHVINITKNPETDEYTIDTE